MQISVRTLFMEKKWEFDKGVPSAGSADTFMRAR
jgi:hypothetical protein